MTSSPSVIPEGLLAMLRCAFAPWRAPDVFESFAKAQAAHRGVALLSAGLVMFFSASVLRNVGFEGRELFPLLVKMAIVIFIPLLISFPGALVLAGVSMGVDALLLVLLLLGMAPPPWMVGAWELGALALCYVFVWRAHRMARPIV